MPEPKKEMAGDTVDLLELLHVMAKRWKLVAKITGAAIVVSLTYALLAPKIYTGTACILPPQQDNGIVSGILGQLGGLASIASSLGGSTTADLYVGILKTDGMKDRIIDRFDLMKVYDEEYRAFVYKKLDKRVDVTAGKKDGIITIAVEDKDPKRAADMANAYVEELGKLTAGLNMAGGGQNRTFLAKRLATAKGDLARAEENLRAFQAKNKALDVPGQARASIEGIALLKGQLAAQEVQLATLRSRFTDSTQEVADQKAAIARIKAEIASMEGKGGGAIPSVGSVPALGQEYVRLMREFKIQETLVDLLTKQYEMAKLTEANSNSTVQVIQSARVPDRKSKPKRAFIVVFATFVGFCAGSFSAFVMESWDGMTEEDRRRWGKIKSCLRMKKSEIQT